METIWVLNYYFFVLGVKPELLEHVLRPKKALVSSSTSKDIKYSYSNSLVDRILNIIIQSCQPSCRVRLVTLELAVKLLVQLVTCDGKNILTEPHKATIETAKSQSTALLRNFYKSEEIFLDMFEHEYCDMTKTSLNVEWLCMDSAILLPPTGTPLSGIDFIKRLPCGEVKYLIFFLFVAVYININSLFSIIFLNIKSLIVF